LKHVHEVFLEARTNYATIMRALSARTAREGTTHALDLDAAAIQCIIQRITDIHPTHGRTCAFLWYSGMRCHDLTELRRKQVTFQDGFLRIEIRFTKTIRGPADGVELRIPCVWLPEVDWNTADLLVSHIQKGEPEEWLFPDAEATEINATIRRACTNLGMRAQAGTRHFPTTYTFRRSFVHAMESRFRDARTGIVNWGHVTQYTLHQTERCVRGFYVSSVSDVQLTCADLFDV
jgi:integrase